MDNKKIQRSGIFSGLMYSSIFGFSFMFSRIALTYLSTEGMLMLRFLIAFSLMLVISLTVSKSPKAPKWLQVNLKGKPILPLLIMGLLQPVAYFICEANGVKLTNSSISGVMIATIPVCAMFFGFVLLKEKVTAKQIMFAFVSVVGIGLLTLGQKDSGTTNPIGIAYLFGAVLSGALFNILSRRFSADYTPMESTLVMMGVGAVVFTAAALIRGADIRGAMNAPVILSLLYLGILSSIAAFMFLNYTNSVLPVAKSTSFSNVTTVLSLFAGVIFLHEPMKGIGYLASALIIIGIIGVQRNGKTE